MKPKRRDGRFKNGYTDGSGKGDIFFDNKQILATHWGCGCCDNGPTDQEILLAEEIVEFLNKKGFWKDKVLNDQI